MNDTVKLVLFACHLFREFRDRGSKCHAIFAYNIAQQAKT